MMAALANVWNFQPERETVTRPWEPPASDWALMADVSSFRAGVPEALIHWRRARGEALPEPML